MKEQKKNKKWTNQVSIGTEQQAKQWCKINHRKIVHFTKNLNLKVIKFFSNNI